MFVHSLWSRELNSRLAYFRNTVIDQNKSLPKTIEKAVMAFDHTFTWSMENDILKLAH